VPKSAYRASDVEDKRRGGREKKHVASDLQKQTERRHDQANTSRRNRRRWKKKHPKFNLQRLKFGEKRKSDRVTDGKVTRRKK